MARISWSTLSDSTPAAMPIAPPLPPDRLTPPISAAVAENVSTSKPMFVGLAVARL